MDLFLITFVLLIPVLGLPKTHGQERFTCTAPSSLSDDIIWNASGLSIHRDGNHLAVNGSSCGTVKKETESNPDGAIVINITFVDLVCDVQSFWIHFYEYRRGEGYINITECAREVVVRGMETTTSQSRAGTTSDETTQAPPTTDELTGTDVGETIDPAIIAACVVASIFVAAVIIAIIVVVWKRHQILYCCTGGTLRHPNGQHDEPPEDGTLDDSKLNVMVPEHAPETPVLEPTHSDGLENAVSETQDTTVVVDRLVVRQQPRGSSTRGHEHFGKHGDDLRTSCRTDGNIVVLQMVPESSDITTKVPQDHMARVDTDGPGPMQASDVGKLVPAVFFKPSSGQPSNDARAVKYYHSPKEPLRVCFIPPTDHENVQAGPDEQKTDTVHVIIQ